MSAARLLLLLFAGAAMRLPTLDAQLAVPALASVPRPAYGADVSTPAAATMAFLDSTTVRSGWLPGAPGALIGAAVGLAAGAFLVRGLCDAPDCSAHPDTRKLLVGGAAVGALIGVTAEVLWRVTRSSRQPRSGPSPVVPPM